jgi:glycosyltransferase involved in cell wall biosynthesis
MKLTLCTIAKNEKTAIPVMLDSVKGVVDEVVILDTGSDDGTQDATRRFVDEHMPDVEFKLIQGEWKNSFAQARNEALEHCTGDWILILDCDERLSDESKDKLRPAIESMPDSVELVCPEMLMCKDNGEINDKFVCERILRNGRGIRFAGAMHNTVNVPDDPAKRIALPDIKLVHNLVVKSPASRAARSKQRLDMAESVLLENVKNDPNDRRSLFYLAGTYYDSGMYDKARDWFEKYMQIGNWDQELYQAAIMLGDCYKRLGDRRKSRDTYSGAIAYNWRRNEAYMELGKLAKEDGDYEQAKSYFQIASLKPMPVDSHFVEVESHTYGPHVELWETYSAIGDNASALEHARRAVELGADLEPEMVKFAKNHTFYRTDRICCLVDRGQMDFIQPLIDHWLDEGKSVITRTDISDIPEADIIWCEWAGEECIKLTHQEKKCRVIVRVHGYETHNGNLQSVNWNNVDDVIFVADYLRDLAIEQVPDLPRICNIYVVGGGVEVDKFSIGGSAAISDGGYLLASHAELDYEKYKDMLTSSQGRKWWSRPTEYQWILERMRDGDIVLDLGAGNSGFAELIAARGCDVIRQDVDAEAMLAELKRNPDIPCIIGNDYGENRFDTVVSCSVLEHVDDIPGLFRNIYRSLKHGGRLIMTFDVPRVMPSELKEMLVRAGFYVGEVNDTVPDNAIGGVWRNGWERDDIHATLRCYALVAYKTPGVKTGNKIAMACYGNQKKNFPLALQILAKCPGKELHIATEWQDHRLKMYVEHMIDELGLRGRVFFYPWQTDLNEFYRDKDFYLSTSEEESFHYALAEGMSAGLKPVVHCWKSARDFYDDRWIFATVDEAVAMLADAGDPQEYRQYAVEHLNIYRNIRRVDRIISRPSIGVYGCAKSPYAMEYKLANSLENIGCRTDLPNPDVAIVLTPDNDDGEWKNAKHKILWYTEQIVGDDDHAKNRRERIRNIAPDFDVCVSHYPDGSDMLKEMGAKEVACVPCFTACYPFRKLNAPKQYDIGFCGHVNERRKRILEELGEKFDIAIFENYDHEQVNLFYNQCRVVLNLHCTDKPNLETRLGEALAAGAVVVSEPLPVDIPGVYDLGRLSDLLQEALEKQLPTGHWWIWRNQRLEHSAEKLLELVGL